MTVEKNKYVSPVMEVITLRAAKATCDDWTFDDDPFNLGSPHA